MFGERCTLCGGKLDSRKRCKECGLDNRKSEKYYKINKSACDGMPMTHVHEEREEDKPKKRQDPAWGGKKQAAPKTYRQAGPSHQHKKGGWISKFVTGFVILSIVGTVIGSLAEMDFDGDLFSESDDTYERPDPYETLYDTDTSLPEEGSYEEFELPSGKYIVGVHLPAGYYSADVVNDYDVVRVADDEHSIFLYEYPAQEEGNYLDDLRLFDGALVEVLAEEPVTLTTENAQEAADGMDNPLKKDYAFSGDIEKTAGEDFEEGVYDLSVTEGYGTVEVKVSPDGSRAAEDENAESYSIDLGTGFSGGTEYKNVVFPAGAEMVLMDSSGDVEESFQISLTPSPKIRSEDYMQIYEDYYRD